MGEESSGPGGPGNFAGVTIQHCLFIRTGDAIDVVCWDNSVIRDNVFTNNTNAIRGDLGRYFGTKAIISDNMFTGSTRSVVGDELCYNSRNSTLWGENITLENNYFENNKGAIFVYTRNNIIQNNTFINNQAALLFSCGNPAYGLIRFYDGDGLMINNVFDGNTSASYGNLLNFAGPWDVANNLFENNTKGTISFSGAVNACSNKFFDNTGNIIYSSVSVAASTVRHNEFHDNSGGAFNATIALNNNAFSTNSIINNNEFEGNSAGSIVSIINSNANLRHNNFLNNTCVSTVQVNGSIVPVLAQNNFVNPGVQYELENLLPFGPGANITMPDNYWGTTDPAHIDSVIKDFFDDANLSVVYYSPVLDSSAGIDTAAVCEGDPLSLSGIILTETGIPVPGVTVRLSGDDAQTYFTGANGRYDFTVAAGGSYTIAPSKNNDIIANNGITSIDVLLMRRHILGMGPLGSPYKIIAAAEANADADTQVSTLDILLARSLILGSATSFSTNRLWQFVSSDYVFPDNNFPFPFSKSRIYTDITISQTNQNFIGIKLGDVNDSWDPNVP